MIFNSNSILAQNTGPIAEVKTPKKNVVKIVKIVKMIFISTNTCATLK